MNNLKTFEQYNKNHLKSVGKNGVFEVFFDASKQEYIVFKDDKFFADGFF